VEIEDKHNQKLFEELKLNSLNYLFYHNGRKLHQIKGAIKKDVLKQKIEEYLGDGKNAEKYPTKKISVEEIKLMALSKPTKKFSFGPIAANNQMRSYSTNSNISGLSLVSETWKQNNRKKQ
jgi:hypothetical protein